MDDVVVRIRAWSPSCTIESSAIQGSVAEVLLERTNGADLLVIGSLGGHKLLRLHPVGEHIADHAACPIVVVPRQASS